MSNRFVAGLVSLACLLLLGVGLRRADAATQGSAPRLDAPPASAPAAQPKPAPAWAYHVPPATVGIVRVRSLNALDSALKQLEQAFDETFEFDAQSLAQLVFEADASHIDPERELAAAFVQVPGTPMPQFRFFLPSATPDWIVESAQQGGAHAEVIDDDYVLVSSEERSDVPSAEPHPLALALLPGQIALQVDLEKLVAANRMLIDVALDEEQQGIAEDEMPPGFGESVFGFVHEMLDAALGFGCALRLEDGIIEYEQRFTAQVGNPYGGWFGGEATDLSAHRHLIDPEAGISVLSNLDPRPGAEFVLGFEDFILEMARADLSAEPTPEEEHAPNWIARFFEGCDTFATLCGTAQAFSFDVDAEEGPWLALHTRGAKPDELASAHAAWLDWAHESAGGLQLGASAERELAGRRVRARQLKSDAAAFEWLKAMAAKDEDEAGQRTLARMTSWFDSLALELTYATRADEWFLGVGSEASVARALARAERREARLDPVFERALERCGSGVPAAVYRVDFARLFGWIESAEDEMAALADRPADPVPRFAKPACLHGWGTHGETEFAGGYVFDLGDLGEFVRIMKTWPDAARAEAPAEEDSTAPAASAAPADETE